MNNIITIEELGNFSEVVVSKIHDDFADVTLQAIRYFYPDKVISEWEDNFKGVEIIFWFFIKFKHMLKSGKK